MNITHFRNRYPDHPLTNLLNLLQADKSQHDYVSTWQGMAAGMVVLLAHQNQLTHDEAVELMEEIAPQPITAANDPAQGVTS